MEKNSKSIDGMPAILEAPHVKCGFKNCWEEQKGKYEAPNAARVAGMEKKQAQDEALCQEKAVNSGSKVDEVFRAMKLPEWLDQKTVSSFIIGATFATMMHYAGFALV